MGEDFSATAMFQYNRQRKFRFAFLLYVVLFFIAMFAASYFLFLQHKDIAFLEFFRGIIAHITQNIDAGTLLGVLYASLFGGLFFITIPMELVFISFLRAGTNPYFLLFTFIGGFIISFTANYYIGVKLDTFSKKVISPKKFYKIKGVLNRYGSWAVFAINAIPFLPSQPLSTVLGVFKYNRVKFYVYFVSGQFLKYAAIAITYIYILGLPG
ncbi:VTT domain-containing protein [Candidatus Woesearchaeota archaeon]|nr:VTT domain-containing protein [Candidatus Woesearchaeota archaeon]